jgi:hypothetical protein
MHGQQNSKFDKFACTCLRSWLFLYVTQRSVVATDVSGKHIGHVVKGQTVLDWFGLLDAWRWDLCVVPKRRLRTTYLRCVTSQKSQNLIYTASETCN